MQVKALEIAGFKTFVDRVKLSFQPGITALVGPNGCGKSNIIDAFRWIMGEQNARNLRGKLMEDLIFNGSESRKPMGMAEVSLIMSNENGHSAEVHVQEIMVTRRLYRSGESEYLINRIPCRLKDIVELFLDAG
ncbi:MAG: AAA family ATPase, partial [Proteobacteria bacterium]|nr:AAA family ATPase [Pseudomonadota bacterium]